VYPSPQLSSHTVVEVARRLGCGGVVSSRASHSARCNSHLHAQLSFCLHPGASGVGYYSYISGSLLQPATPACSTGSTNPNQRFDHTLLKAHSSPHQHQLPCYGNRLPPPSTPHSALTSAYNHACKHVHHRSSSTASHPVSCGVRDSRAAHCHAPCCPQLSTVGCRKHAHALVHPNQPSRFTETPLGCCCNVYDTRRPTDDGAQT
jgi:hypothetical protein